MSDPTAQGALEARETPVATQGTDTGWESRGRVEFQAVERPCCPRTWCVAQGRMLAEKLRPPTGGVKRNASLVPCRKQAGVTLAESSRGIRVSPQRKQVPISAIIFVLGQRIRTRVAWFQKADRLGNIAMTGTRRGVARTSCTRWRACCEVARPQGKALALASSPSPSRSGSARCRGVIADRSSASGCRRPLFTDHRTGA